MLKFTRVTGILDVGRLGNALSRPGIDPRTWISYATVDGVGVDGEGVFVDVTLLPSGEQMTARAGTIYAGPGYGLHLPFGVNDEVVVGVPNGDPGHGAVVLGRLQSASDQLSSDAQGNADDIVLVVKDGQSVRIGVSGGGKVYLADVNATEQAVLGTTYRSAEDSRFAAMDALAEALATAISTLSAASPTLTNAPAIPAWTAAVTAVSAALTAYTAAVSAFSANELGYLSNTVAVGS
jgi:Type VI secretion system/phage-baseplate injector OB domain